MWQSHVWRVAGALLLGCSSLGMTACGNATREEPETTMDVEQEVLEQEDGVRAAPQAAPQVLSPGDDSAGAALSPLVEEHAALQQELRAYLGRTQADDLTQCALLPYGYNPCGGPARYIAYSRKGMSDAELGVLEQQLSRFNQLDAFLQSQRMGVGRCGPTPEPELALINGRCVADQQAVPGAGPQ